MSNIEWTQETWQVTSGCSKVSAGCAKAAGVPVFVKQLGALVIEDEQRWRDRSNFGRTRLLSCNKAKHAPAGTVAWSMQHSKGGDPAEWPEDLRVREMPREVAPTGGEAA